MARYSLAYRYLYYAGTYDRINRERWRIAPDCESIDYAEARARAGERCYLPSGAYAVRHRILRVGSKAHTRIAERQGLI